MHITAYQLLVVVLVLALLGAFPVWPYNRRGNDGPGWGYYPSGLFLFLILMLLFCWR